MAHSTTAVSIQSLSKTYRTKSGATVTALHDVDLDIADGEFVSIVGPSGCGKSTLLKVLLGEVQATAGRVDLGAAPDRGGHRLGMVFQQPLLLPWRTVTDNLLLSHDLNGGFKDPAVRRRADDTLERLGLRDFARTYPRELSGGMQQRVGIGRALMHDPQVLMMDEPFGALDAMTRDQMSLDLLDIWERDRKTVVFVTHSIPEAVLLSDRVVVMSPRPGRIVDVVGVDLDRPRDLQMINTPEFGDHVRRIRDVLDAGQESR